MIVPIPDATGLEEALSRSLGIRGRIEKTRTLFVWGHTRIHLDDVVGLGSFLELETVMEGIDRREAEAETHVVIEALDLDPGAFLDVPYLELLTSAAAAFPR